MLINDNVVLEELDSGNMEKLRNWRNDPEVRKYFRVYKDITRDMQAKWYSSIGNNSNDSHIYFQIMTFEDEIDKRNLVGVCNLSYINWHTRSAEAAIFVAEGGGKGIGTKALQTMCKYGFEELNMNKIWCEIFDNNPRSLHLFKKVGFIEEGLLRANHFSEGKYGDSHRLSLFRDELVVV